ncbi:MAG TPA: L,D-transpeptidase family protein [Stellaceae bacterium]|nr:L,D-transpeptidase family protein [Stellaceae bacterium]
MIPLFTRRAVLAIPVHLAAASLADAASDQDLEYRDGWLRWPDGMTRAAIGWAGVSTQKKEGDGTTPAGVFPLIRAFYRADRISPPPQTRLPLRALSPRDGWVDDPADRSYNHLVSLPYPAHTEAMWLADAVYDLLVVIGYNIAPVIRGAGSAIFLHIARPDFSPTAGCVAIEQAALVKLMPLLGPGSRISIHV